MNTEVFADPLPLEPVKIKTYEGEGPAKIDPK